MAKGERPSYKAFVSRPGKGGKPFYREVGAAWHVSGEGISIKLDALPTDGSLVLFPNRADDTE